MIKLIDEKTIVFGPVPSRRLGRSLGINNIPPKTCSYSCIYCQLGKTLKKTITRRTFYEPKDIFKEVKRKVDAATARGERIDYLTFVPDGEPTLDINMGQEISLLRQFGIPIAVITNASLLWRDDLKDDLLEADFVSLKIDVVSQDLWKSINRPSKGLELSMVLDGIKEFVKMFKGIIVSETMLINNIEYNSEFKRIARFLRELNRLNKAYVAIPTRPPAEKWVKPAKEEVINAAFQIFSENLGSDRVEYLIGYEGNAFAFTGNIEEDLLSITAVHPMREEAVKELLKKANANWQVVEKLLCENKLVELEYEGKTFYMRRPEAKRNFY